MSKNIKKSENTMELQKRLLHRMIEEISNEEDTKTLSSFTQRIWLEQKKCKSTKRGEIELMLNNQELSDSQLSLISDYIAFVGTFSESLISIKKERIFRMLNDLNDLTKINIIYQLIMGIWKRRS